MKTLILILLIATSFLAWSQEGSYIIKREMYKTNLTSINFPPTGNSCWPVFRTDRSGYWIRKPSK